MTNSSNQIKSGAIISYIAIFFNIAAGLLYTPWMVRQIGIADFGLYTLIGAFLSYFLIDFGLGSAIARFIARYRAEDNEAGINNILGLTSRIYLLIDLVIFITLAVVFFLISGIFKELTPVEIDKLKVIYVIAGFFSIVSFPFTAVDGVMIAYERFQVLKATDMVQKILVIVLMVVALLLGYGLFALVFVNGLVGLFIKLYKFYYIKQKTSIRINIHFFDKPLARELIKLSFWVFVIGIAQRLMLNIVPTELGILSGTEQIAIFSIAMTLEGYVYVFASALNGFFLPKITRMVMTNEDRKEVNYLMIRVGRLQLLVLGLLITGIVVLGKPFIQLWMGDKFIPSYYVSLFLIVPGIITFTQEIAATLLFVVNEMKYRAMLFIVASLISIIIGVILIPTLGAMGAAIGVGTALLLFHVLGMNFVYSWKLKLDMKLYFYSVHIKMIWPIVVSGVISMLMQYFFPVDTWMSFLVSGIFFTLIYTTLMWGFVMNAEEKGLVMSVVNKIRK